jgi:hypothetical protein
MIRIGKDERELRCGVSGERRILNFGGKFAAVCRRAATTIQMQLHPAAGKGLAQTVRGDQAKPFRFARAHQRGR